MKKSIFGACLISVIGTLAQASAVVTVPEAGVAGSIAALAAVAAVGAIAWERRRRGPRK